MKPKSIIIDLATDTMTIGICQSFRIPIVSVTKNSRTNATVYCITKTIIPTKTNIAISVPGIKLQPLENRLPDDRNLFFEFRIFDTSSIYIHIIDCYMNQIIIKNDTETIVISPKNTKLGHVVENESTECYAVDSDEHVYAAKTPIRQSNWFKPNFRKIVAITAVFSATIAPEFTHHTGDTIYGDADSRTAIVVAIGRYSNLWKNTGNVINIPDDEFMDIPFVENWRELYKPGQTRMYPIGGETK